MEVMEVIEVTRLIKGRYPPSDLECLSRQDSENIKCQYESVWVGTGWYLVVLGQYNLVLLGIKWYWVDMKL